MNSSSTVEVAAPTGMIEQYETLRANALGRINQSCGLLLFMQQGMIGWLQTLARSSTALPVAPQRPTDSAPRAATKVLAGIMADAILEVVGSVSRREP